MLQRRWFLSSTALVLAGGLAPPRRAFAQATGLFTEKVLGDPDAPVEIREYSSLTCPHCASWHAEELPGLKANYIDTGKAKLVFRDFPLDLRAWLASAVAHCAGEESFFPFLDMLFTEQTRWAGAPTTRADGQRLEEAGLPDLWRDAGRTPEEVDSLMSVAGTVNALVDLARFGGLAPEDSYQCLADFDLLDWILEAQFEGRERYGVEATPTFIIDGERLEGGRSSEDMGERIDAVLARG